MLLQSCRGGGGPNGNRLRCIWVAVLLLPDEEEASDAFTTVVRGRHKESSRDSLKRR